MTYKKQDLTKRDWARACGWGSGPSCEVSQKQQALPYKAVGAQCLFVPERNKKAKVISIASALRK